MSHHQKSMKMHAFFCIFAFWSFITKQKTRILTLNLVAPKSPFIFFNAITSETIFKSKKTQKHVNNTFSKYIWAPKMLQKSSLFHQKWASCFQCKLFIFHRYLYVNGPKKMCKNRSFFIPNSCFFTAKSSFSSFSVYICSKKVEQNM